MNRQDLTELLVGATIIEVGVDRHNELTSLLVSTKSGIVYKLESYGEYGSEAWNEITEVGKKLQT